MPKKKKLMIWHERKKTKLTNPKLLQHCRADTLNVTMESFVGLSVADGIKMCNVFVARKWLELDTSKTIRVK